MKNNAKIIYLGTPAFAVAPLKAMVEAGYNVIAVVCNPDAEVGRKRILTPPPVKEYAASVGIPVYQYHSIRKEGVSDMQALSPDLMVTCAFGQILSQEIIDIPTFGIYNLHGSLLPKFRGASPIQSAIIAGETLTGITRTTIEYASGNTVVIENGYLDIGIIDTIKDMFVNLIGAVVFSFIGYFYIKRRGKGTIASQFIPVLISDEQSDETKNESENATNDVTEGGQEKI